MININCFEDLTDDQMNLVEMSAIFVMNNLGLYHDLTININTLDEMDNSEGLCYSPDEFDICFEKDFDVLFRVIAHELRHVYQRYYGYLTCDKKWYGESYNNVSYDELPWEVDANRYEEEVFKMMKLYKG